VCYSKAGLSEERQRDLFARIEPQAQQPLVKVAGELFRNLVVFEKATRAPALAIIKDRIWALMDAAERADLFSALVAEFLSKPEGTYSQKSVVDALDSLRMPAGELIGFLSQTFNLGSSKSKQKTEKPRVIWVDSHVDNQENTKMKGHL